MLGLRTETDLIPKINYTSQRNGNFSKKLEGRFFVAGVSGSLNRHFEKTEYERRLKAISTIDNSKTELQNKTDKKKLQSIEKEWEALNHIRNLHHRAACVIQRVVKRYIAKCRRHNSDIIASFLRSLYIKRAIFARSYASIVIKRFLIRVSHIICIPNT